MPIAGLANTTRPSARGRRPFRLKPDDAGTWLALGLAFKRSGQQSQAIRVYQKLKNLDPELADKFFKEAVLP